MDLYKTWIENEMFDSPAWNDLGGKAPHVLMEFYRRRQSKNIGKKKGKPIWVTDNERHLELTYAEAAKKGFTRRMFTYAIDSLIEHGFIDIVEYGGGLEHKKTIYGLSKRWKKYGTDDYVDTKRTKHHRGFCSDEHRFKHPEKQDEET